MFGVSAEWKKIKEQTPHLLKKPLQVLMMECILNELAARLKTVAQDKTARTMAIQADWMTEAGQRKYKAWDPAKKALVETGAAPLNMQDLDGILKTMSATLQEPGVLHKFQASQPMRADMETTTEHKEVCFTIQVALRGDKAEQLHQCLTKLGDSMALKLLRSRLRPERAQRHGLAKQVSDLLRQQ